MWRAFVQRQHADAVSGLLTTVVLMVTALVLIARPAETIGQVSSLANRAAIGMVAGATTGTLNRPEASFGKATARLFDALVLRPWCALQFADVEFCVSNPRKTIPEGELPDDKEVRSAWAVAPSVADLWLRFEPNGSGDGNDQRNRIYEKWRDNDDDRLQALVRIQKQGGTAARIALLLLIAIGMVAAIGLLGWLVFRLLGFGVLALLLVLLAPVMFLAPALGDSGRATFVGWAKRLLGCLVAKAIYAMYLAVVLVAAAALEEAYHLGWLAAWALQVVFWWAVLLKRNALLEFVTAPLPDKAASHARGGVGHALQSLYHARALAREGSGLATKVAAPITRPATAARAARSDRADAKTAATRTVAETELRRQGRTQAHQAQLAAAAVIARERQTMQALKPLESGLRRYDERAALAAIRGEAPPTQSTAEADLLARRDELQAQRPDPAAVAAAREQLRHAEINRARTGETVTPQDEQAWIELRRRDHQRTPARRPRAQPPGRRHRPRRLPRRVRARTKQAARPGPTDARPRARPARSHPHPRRRRASRPRRASCAPPSEPSTTANFATPATSSSKHAANSDELHAPAAPPHPHAAGARCSPGAFDHLCRLRNRSDGDLPRPQRPTATANGRVAPGRTHHPRPKTETHSGRRARARPPQRGAARPARRAAAAGTSVGRPPASRTARRVGLPRRIPRARDGPSHPSERRARAQQRHRRRRQARAREPASRTTDTRCRARWWARRRHDRRVRQTPDRVCLPSPHRPRRHRQRGRADDDPPRRAMAGRRPNRVARLAAREATRRVVVAVAASPIAAKIAIVATAVAGAVGLLAVLLAIAASSFGEPPRFGAQCEPANVGADTQPVPARFVPIYHRAATRYRLGERGVSILISIHQHESDFGDNQGPSSAGAVGHMQFMPDTWAAYGVDADHDGREDPGNAADAIYAAARYLRATGAPGDWYRAIFAYNHADWYVQLILSTARGYEGVCDEPDLPAQLGDLPANRLERIKYVARWIESRRYHYCWGGGHAPQPGPSPQRHGYCWNAAGAKRYGATEKGLDCSGAVRWLLVLTGYPDPGGLHPTTSAPSTNPAPDATSPSGQTPPISSSPSTAETGAPADATTHTAPRTATSQTLNS